MGTLEIQDDIYKKTRKFCDDTDQRFKTFVETAIEEFLNVATLSENFFRACKNTNTKNNINKNGKEKYNIQAHEKILSEILEGIEIDPHGHRRRYHQSRIDRYYFGLNK